MRTLAFLFAVACAPQQQEPAAPPGAIVGGTPVFTVDGRPVTREMLAIVIERLPPEMAERAKVEPEAFEEIQERLAVGDLLYNDALAKNVQSKPEVLLAISLAAREVLGAEVLQTVADEAVTDEAVQKWYDDHQVQFRRPSVHLGHILLLDPKLAESVAAEARGGADFATLARTHGDPQTASMGGDIGWLEKGRLLPVLDGPAFGAAAGEVVGPVMSEAGFHVMKVLERREMTPLDGVRDQIESQLKQDAMDAYVTKLRDAATVTRVAEPFPAEASGDAAAPAAPPPRRAVEHALGGHPRRFVWLRRRLRARPRR